MEELKKRKKDRNPSPTHHPAKCGSCLIPSVKVRCCRCRVSHFNFRLIHSPTPFCLRFTLGPCSCCCVSFRKEQRSGRNRSFTSRASVLYVQYPNFRLLGRDSFSRNGGAIEQLVATLGDQWDCSASRKRVNRIDRERPATKRKRR